MDDGAATSVPPGGTNTTSPVPDTFESVEHYQDVWFPLLLEEMRAETMSEITAEGIGPVSMVGVQQDDCMSGLCPTSRC